MKRVCVCACVCVCVGCSPLGVSDVNNQWPRFVVSPLQPQHYSLKVSLPTRHGSFGSMPVWLNHMTCTHILQSTTWLREIQFIKGRGNSKSWQSTVQWLKSSCVDEHRKLRAALAHEVPLQQWASYHNRTTNPDDDGPTQPHQQCTWHRQQRGTSSCIHNGIVENVHLPHVASVWRPTLPPLWSTWAGDSTWTYISMTWTTHQQGGGTILKPTWVNKLATHPPTHPHIYIHNWSHEKTT